MDTIASLLALAIICLIVVTPAVILGNHIFQKMEDRNRK